MLLKIISAGCKDGAVHVVADLRSAWFWATSRLRSFTWLHVLRFYGVYHVHYGHLLRDFAPSLASCYPPSFQCDQTSTDVVDTTSTIGLMPTQARSSSQGYLSLMVTPHIHRIIDISLRCNLWDSSTLIGQVSLP